MTVIAAENRLDELTARLKNMKSARYIKLGEGGRRAAECLASGASHEGALYIGYFTGPGPLHDLMLQGTEEAWRKVRQEIAADYPKQGAATSAANQVRTVFEDDGSALWFTFFNRQLYWTFVDAPQAIQFWDGNDGIARSTLGWRSLDIKGKPLETWAITTRISQVQAYQRTVRNYLDGKDANGFNPIEYMRSLLLGEEQGARLKTLEATRSLEESLVPLVQLLTDGEFENFVDMIFVSDGWQRVSEVGKLQEAIDGEYFHVTSGMRIAVQTKSSTKWLLVEEALKNAFSRSQHEWVYWAYHTTVETAEEFNEAAVRVLGENEGTDELPWHPFPDDPERRLYLLGPDKLANLAVQKGLVRWLTEKAR